MLCLSACLLSLSPSLSFSVSHLEILFSKNAACSRSTKFHCWSNSAEHSLCTKFIVHRIGAVAKTRSTLWWQIGCAEIETATARFHFRLSPHVFSSSFHCFDHNRIYSNSFSLEIQSSQTNINPMVFLWRIHLCLMHVNNKNCSCRHSHGDECIPTVSNVDCIDTIFRGFEYRIPAVRYPECSSHQKRVV